MKNKRVSSKIYMLPTDKDACLRVKENGELEFSGELSLNIKGFYKNESSQPQNLYFTVDEEIKEGDWFLYIKKDGTAMFPSKFNASKDTLKDGNDRKIIVSTDPKLTNPHKGKSREWFDARNETYTTVYDMAQPSQAFIEAYCKQGGIDEVLVEYQRTMDGTPTYNRLTVDPIHNTITTITDMMKIAMYDLEGNLLDILRGDTLTEISKLTPTKVPASGIQKVLRGERNFTGTYQFRRVYNDAPLKRIGNCVAIDTSKRIAINKYFNGKYVKTYESIDEVATMNKLENSNIARSITDGKRCGGYTWKELNK